MMDKGTSSAASQGANPSRDTVARKAPASVTASPMRSLIRLAVGSVELGAESLLHRLEKWEAAPPPAADGNSNQVSSVPNLEQAMGSDPGAKSSALELARLMTIGAIFDAQERLEHGFTQIGRAGNAANRLAIRASRPLRWIPGVKPLQRGIDRLAARGEQEVSRWIKIGRQEEQQSKALAEKVILDTVGEYVQYLADHPAVEELVEEQSTSLATEVVEEVRERAVSLDTFLEGIARGMLRRIPRSSLPQPPAPVKMSATTLRNRPEVKGKVQ